MAALFSFLIFLAFSVFGSGLRQERAIINYYDPKYIKDPQVFTFRQRRRDSYKTNLTATTLHTWGNNVTFLVEYDQKHSGKDVILKGKICVLLNINWIREFLLSYLESLPNCPVPPGIYGLWNLELPPKNFPLPLPKGESNVIITYYLEEKTRLLQCSVQVK